MDKNIFFKKKNIKINKLYPNINFKKNFLISDIKSLETASKNQITFFDSLKYKNFAQKTKASACITHKKIERFLPPSTTRIIVENVLFELAKVIKKIYPDSDIDYNDNFKNPKQKII